ADMRCLKPRQPMPGSPAGKASTFTTFDVRSLRSGWATRMAIQPPKSILLGSHSSPHLISRLPLWTRLPPVARFLMCCDFSCAATSLRQRCAEFSNDHDEPERRAEDPHLHTFIPGREGGHQRAC